MPKENNKMQVDIDTLKKQNVNDLLSIKQLYSKLEELGEKITQIKYIDNTLVKKIKKEYEKLEKIILDENIQVKLTNDIETINSHLNNKANKSDIETINLQLDTVTSNNLRIINAMEYIDFKENIDCSTDINNLIQSMNKNETLLLPYFNYYTNNTILINRDINVICKGTINYTGNGSAIKIIQSENKTIEFNRINALNGSCIELFSNTGNFIQYLSLYFVDLRAKKYCIYLNLEDKSDGWINENRFYGGRFTKGEVGCYADAHNLDSINSNKFFEIGVEGVDLGFSFNNLCNYIYMINCRVLESRDLITTTGTNKDLKIIGTNILYASRLKFSNTTNAFILMPLVDDGGGIISDYCSVYKGKIVLPLEKRRYRNCGNPAGGVFDLRNETKAIEYNCFYFLAGQNVTSLILNELYGKEIYEFYVKLNFDSEKAFEIKDSNENIIFNNTTGNGWSLLRFNYCREMGWIAEKVNTLKMKNN